MRTSYTLDQQHPLVIIGAGPIGLAAAAKCAANGVPFRLLEAGRSAAAAVADWGHVRLFSPWAECIDATARELLRSSGWVAPIEIDYPYGRVLVADYLRPLSRLPAIAANSRCGARVVAVERSDGMCGAPIFSVRTSGGSTFAAGAVIDASGTWGRPRTLAGARSQKPRISYRIPDVRSVEVSRKLAGKRIAIIGSGHSGMTLLLDLAELKTARELIWIRRGAVVHSGARIGPNSARLALERRAEAAAVSASVRVVDGMTVGRVRTAASCVRLIGQFANGSRVEISVDHAFASLGFDPDHSIASGLKLALDPVLAAPVNLAELIDPRKHSCNSVPTHGWSELAHPEPGYFIAGSKSYGRAPNFALSTGYAQLDSILAHVAPDRFASRIAACKPCQTQCA